jgi:ABC-2 type transport system ATP-binding protein
MTAVDPSRSARSNEAGPAIEASGLSKAYPRRAPFRSLLSRPFGWRWTPVLTDVSFSVQRGEVFGLLGCNGAGKTTLMKLLCTLLLPDSGTARVNGFDIEKEARSVRRSIGCVFADERSFYWRLTGRQNLRFFAALSDLAGGEAGRRIDEVLALTGLTSSAGTMVKDYSTGMRQRLAIARGLLARPGILILDEPTRSLDPAAAAELRRLIRADLAGVGGRTIVVATNLMEEAAALCDRVAVLSGGRIRACGDLRSLQRMANGAARYSLQVTASEAHSLKVLRDFMPSARISAVPVGNEGNRSTLHVELHDGEPDLSQLLTCLLGAGMKIEGCQKDELPLDELFIRLVG